MVIEATDAKIGALALAAAIRVVDEATIPPTADVIKDVVVDDTVAERRGKNFTNDRVHRDKSDAAIGVVAFSEDVAAKLVDVLHEVSLKLKFVTGGEFVFASLLKSGIEVNAKLMIEWVKLEMFRLSWAIRELVEDLELLLAAEFFTFCRHICLP